MPDEPASIRAAATAELTSADLAALRALFAAAWPGGGFGADDFAHAMGGRHWLAEVEGRIVAHASVVGRELRVGDVVLETGYLEAVATHPARERRGLGSAVVAAAGDHIRRSFRLGALSTDRPAFYLRLGWERWRGPTFVRMPGGELVRTEDEDEGILVLRTPATPPLDLRAPIACDWRPGDAW
jgi:aminoglycoside 2'-N-acetyltransferase I